jgi:hypothetical protein
MVSGVQEKSLTSKKQLVNGAALYGSIPERWLGGGAF